MFRGRSPDYPGVGPDRRRDYRGVVCLTAEYSDEAAVDRLAAEDLSFARDLFAQA